MIEYNLSSRYVVSKIENRKEDTKTTLKEVVDYIIMQLKRIKTLKPETDCG